MKACSRQTHKICKSAILPWKCEVLGLWRFAYLTNKTPCLLFIPEWNLIFPPSPSLWLNNNGFEAWNGHLPMRDDQFQMLQVTSKTWHAWEKRNMEGTFSPFQAGLVLTSAKCGCCNVQDPCGIAINRAVHIHIHSIYQLKYAQIYDNDMDLCGFIDTNTTNSINICVYMCMYVCMYIYIYIDIHT